MCAITIYRHIYTNTHKHIHINAHKLKRIFLDNLYIKITIYIYTYNVYKKCLSSVVYTREFRMECYRNIPPVTLAILPLEMTVCHVLS